METSKANQRLDNVAFVARASTVVIFREKQMGKSVIFWEAIANIRVQMMLICRMQSMQGESNFQQDSCTDYIKGKHTADK